MRNLKILVIGLKGVAAEISKNLILSGVKSITMMDPEKVVEGDINSQYFFYPEDVGQNVNIFILLIIEQYLIIFFLFNN